MSGQNRKDIEAKLKRAPAGCERIWIGEEPWHIKRGKLAIACHQPLTNESFGILIADVKLSDPVAIKKAILAKSAFLATLKQQEVTPTIPFPASG